MPEEKDAAKKEKNHDSVVTPANNPQALFHHVPDNKILEMNFTLEPGEPEDPRILEMDFELPEDDSAKKDESAEKKSPR